jgi:hypothetical protein
VCFQFRLFPFLPFEHFGKRSSSGHFLFKAPCQGCHRLVKPVVDLLVSLSDFRATDRFSSFRIGSTMGSRDEFFAAVAFIAKHEIHPVVDTLLNGLEEAEKGFELLKKGGQFGKVRF